MPHSDHSKPSGVSRCSTDGVASQLENRRFDRVRKCRQQADSGDRYQPHRCEHVLHRTLVAATDYRKWKHLITASEQRSYVRYLQLRGGWGAGEKVSIHETGVNFFAWELPLPDRMASPGHRREYVMTSFSEQPVVVEPHLPSLCRSVAATRSSRERF